MWVLIKGMVEPEKLEQVQEVSETDDIFTKFRNRMISDNKSTEDKSKSKTGYVSSNDPMLPGYHLNSDGSVPKSPIIPPILNDEEK